MTAGRLPPTAYPSSPDLAPFRELPLRDHVAALEYVGLSPLEARLAILGRLAGRAHGELAEISGRYRGLYRDHAEAEVLRAWREFWGVLRFQLELPNHAEAVAHLDRMIARVEPPGDDQVRA